jgi:hypothetical protein
MLPSSYRLTVNQSQRSWVPTSRRASRRRTCSRAPMELSSLAAEERRGRVIVPVTQVPSVVRQLVESAVSL